MKLLALLTALIAVGALTAHACGDGLTVQSPWIVAVPPNAKATAAFMTLINKDDEPVEIVGGTCEIAGLVEPMIGTNHDGMAGMKTVPALTVPAKGQLVLKPGGDHIMLMKLHRAPKEGETLKLILKLACGREIIVEAPVSKTAPESK